MRLFYLITIVLFLLNLAAFATQEKPNNGFKKSFNSSSISLKKLIKLSPVSCQDDEGIEKALINPSSIPFQLGIFLPLVIIFLNYFCKVIVDHKLAIRKFRFNYWCLFKMLYPKHVFW